MSTLPLNNNFSSFFLKTSEIGSSDQYRREQEKENLRLSSENIELRFQLEQANKDLPRLKVTSYFSPLYSHTGQGIA